MIKKVLTGLKCICLFLVFSFPLKIITILFSEMRLTACMCYDMDFIGKMILFIGLLLSDLIGVILSAKIVSKKTDLSNNKLILPFYLITILLGHPALGDLSYFKLFDYSLGPNFDYTNFYYHSELERFIINNFDFVNNITSIFFILMTILVYSLIIFIINKKTKKKQS